MPHAAGAQADPRLDGLTYPDLIPDDVFWFIHISDLHIIDDRSVAESFLASAVDILPRAIAPEFIVATGDLTDAELALDRNDEWQRYSTLVSPWDFFRLYRDIPGNHDRWGDPDWDGVGASAGIGGYLNLSASGYLSEPGTPGMFKWTVQSPAANGTHLFLAANTNDPNGTLAATYFSQVPPISDLPDLSAEELSYLETSLREFRETQGSRLAFIFGHHGLFTTAGAWEDYSFLPGLADWGTGGEELVRLVRDWKVSAYLYGHTHENDESYELLTVQLNTASLGDFGHYRIVAVDNGGVSTARATIDTWPVVLITAPVDKGLADGRNPFTHAFPIAAGNPIRALVFADPDSCELIEDSVRMYVDGENRGLMSRASGDSGSPLYNLWEGAVDASGLSVGDHEIKVRAFCTDQDSQLAVYDDDIITVQAQVAPGALSVSPTGGFASSGMQGGPFAPTSQAYTLTNTGGTSIGYSVSEGLPWLTVSSTSGSLGPGASTVVTLSITSAANSLSAGSYTGTVSFTNTTNGNGNTSRSASLTVKVTPVVAMTSSPPVIGPGGSAALGWASTGVTSCIASGGWTGSRPPNGGEIVTPVQTSTYMLDCEGPTGTASASVTVVVDAPMPGVVLDATPASILLGEATMLSWSASDAESCDASGGWEGEKGTVGFQQESPISTTTYTLTCTSAFDPAETVSDSVTVEVSSPPTPAPIVTLTALPSSLIAGEQSTLTWVASGADTCSAWGAWVGSLPTSGTQVVTPLATSTYGIDCNGTGGSTSDQVTVVVNPGPPMGSMGVDPSVCPDCRSALIPPGESATLFWEFQGATSCEASGGWSGPRPTTGSEVVSPASSTSYQLGCTGPGGTYWTSVHVNVGLGEPTQITASDYDFADHVEIRWNPVWGASEYFIGRRESWAPARCGGTVIGSTDATVYEDWTAVPGTTYYYWIQATDGSIFSVWNGPDLGHAGDPPPPVLEPPPPPTNVIASDGLFPDRIQVSWNAVESATEYEVWRVQVAAGDNSVLIATLPGTLFEDFAVSAGQPYGYQVRAIAPSGTSGLSLRDDAYVEMPITLGETTGITATDQTYEDRIQLTWNGGATGYWIARDTVWHCAACGGPSIALVAGPPFDDFDVDPLVDYYYWVRPTDGTALGPWNGPDIGSRWGPTLDPPTLIDASDQLLEDRVQVTWAGHGGTSYEIARATAWNCAICGGPVIGSATESPYYDYSAEPGQNYYYWVRAIDGSTVSDWNGPDIGSLAYIAPTEPTLIEATDGTLAERVTVSWSPASGAAFYEVSRSPSPALASCGGGDMLGSTTAPQFEDTSALPGITYYYWVRSGDGTTLSNWNGPDAGFVAVFQCSDGIDNDGDGYMDFPGDPGCDAAEDVSENSALLTCDDGADNDSDGAVDYPADIGCKDPNWPAENPECSDGIDNADSDNPPLADWDGAGMGNRDPECVAPWAKSEAPSSRRCGLGFELVLLLPLLVWLRRRRWPRRG
jgi:fibronectin type 3 domain-containing protein